MSWRSRCCANRFRRRLVPTSFHCEPRSPRTVRGYPGRDRTLSALPRTAVGPRQDHRGHGLRRDPAQSCRDRRSGAGTAERDQVALPETLRASIAGLRTIVVHEYFRVDRDLIAQIVHDELIPLADAIGQLAAGDQEAGDTG
ncbi:HepT-like ribonuclease domain-containing protein [Protofrankia symbiont of Coriaria ruscifolia]|uniref:HepT-like ribonuclease domain-containing protein n=1 Tax=Protofrankia symbiont of Coriaria ruscifolia TaxID=1306542 RepID=UPI00104104E0